MKQKYLQTLLSLVSNYVEHQNTEYNTSTDAYYYSVLFLEKVKEYSELTLTDEEKEEMYWQSVHALNAGNEEAAFYIRLKALCSGDEELIEKIEYLHEVI